MTSLLAISRDDVADYVYTLALVFVALILIRVIMSFIPRIPYYRWLDAFLTFVTQVTDPIINPIRKVVPDIRLGGAGLDLSPMIATFILLIGAGIVSGLIRGG